MLNEMATENETYSIVLRHLDLADSSLIARYHKDCQFDILLCLQNMLASLPNN